MPPLVDKRNDNNLRGNNAIFTGADGDIGIAVARLFLNLGCIVILVVRIGNYSLATTGALCLLLLFKSGLQNYLTMIPSRMGVL